MRLHGNFSLQNFKCDIYKPEKINVNTDELGFLIKDIEHQDIIDKSQPKQGLCVAERRIREQENISETDRIIQEADNARNMLNIRMQIQDETEDNTNTAKQMEPSNKSWGLDIKV